MSPNAQETNLTRTYGRNPYSAALAALNQRYQVHEAATADQLFAAGRYLQCQNICYEILQAQPSEAIAARCHMYLAMEIVGVEYASVRAYHAGMAMHAWKCIIDRTGLSRFPIEAAKAQLDIAKQLFENADEAIAEEDELYTEDEPLAEEKRTPLS